MKRSLGTLVCLCLSVASLAVSAEPADDATVVAMKRAFPASKISEVNVTPFTGIYEVVAGKNVLYTDLSGKYVIFGHVLDVARNKDLTQAVLDRVSEKSNKLEFKDVPLSAAIRSGNPRGKKLVVITDLNCPWCRKLRPELDAMTQFDIYEILVPFKSTMEQIEAVWCAKDRVAALRTHMSGGAVPTHDTNVPCDMAAPRSVEAFVKQHSFFGTPAFVREDGVRLVGYRNRDDLAAWASAAPQTLGRTGSDDDRPTATQ